MAFPRLVRSPDPTHGALDERSDDELMALAQAGSKTAFAALVERHARRVVALCSRFVADPHLGRELAQDTWVVVWQRRESYHAAGGFLPWLVTVARNRCRNQLRRGKLARAHEHAAPEVSRSTPAQLDAVLVEERRRRVRGALAELSVPLREALLLRYAEDLRYDEMTTIVGTGESTLRSRVHHGLKALKQKLEEGS